jgi:hypothetical protein
MKLVMSIVNKLNKKSNNQVTELDSEIASVTKKESLVTRTIIILYTKSL